jgi:hypothetical protein
MARSLPGTAGASGVPTWTCLIGPGELLADVGGMNGALAADGE